MKKHIICGHFGLEDKPSITLKDNEQVTYLDLLDREGKLCHGIGDVVENLAKLNVFPNQVGIELLILAAHIQAADTRISRSTESQDSWTREITLIVPIVGDIEKWAKTSIVLKRSLDFLTGDIWEIRFRKSDYAEPIVAQQKSLVQHTFDSISLFSGGLDSLIGAVDLLEESKRPLFVSHASEGATSTAQRSIFERLKKQYQNASFNRIRLWMSFPTDLIKGSKPEITMRSRSFLFFALGVAAGTGLSQKFTLLVPENGLIALNVPLDPLRVGSHSTHTTHPFYMARWNDLLSALSIDGKLVNPYWNKTKGEMIEGCGNKPLLSELIPYSMSCSSPYKATRKHLSPQHCGYCLPCIIRRASVHTSSITDTTKYDLDDLWARPLNTITAEGRQIRSFQFAINRLKNKPMLSKYLIYSAGSLADVSNEDKISLTHVYIKGLKEVGELLESVKTEPLT